MTDGTDRRRVMAAVGTQGDASPDGYVRTTSTSYKSSQQEGAAQRRRWNAPRASAFWLPSEI
jgi:hypothetical protein